MTIKNYTAGVLVEQYYLIKRNMRLTKDESGKYKPTFYIRYRDDLGRVHEVSTGETSKGRAKLWAKRNFAASRISGADQTFGAHAAKWWTPDPHRSTTLLRRMGARGKGTGGLTSVAPVQTGVLSCHRGHPCQDPRTRGRERRLPC